MDEKSNPWDLLQPQDAMSRKQGAKSLRQCGLSGEVSPAFPGVACIHSSVALPRGTTVSLAPTFIPDRAVALTVKPPVALALNARFPTVLRRPLDSSVTF
jgi:hypothetical protein